MNCMRMTALSVLVVVPVYACGGDDAKDVGTAWDGDPAGYPRAFAEAVCNASIHCCQERDLSWDLDACVQHLVDQEEKEIERLQKRGGQFNATAARDCVEEFRGRAAQHCTEVDLLANLGLAEEHRISAVCDQIWQGTTPIGESCYDDPDYSRVLCEAMPGRITRCSGPADASTCVVYDFVAEGQSCENTDSSLKFCDRHDLYCDISERTCKPAVPTGGPCGPDSNCGPYVCVRRIVP